MQLKLHTVTIETMVPEEHFLRKLERVMDLSFVYEATAKLYNHRYSSRPTIRWSWCNFCRWGICMASPRSGRLSSVYRQTLLCDSTWGWICLTVCRITAQFSSCSGENRLSGKSFDGCLKKWWGNVSKKGWSVEDWWLRILPM